MSRHFLEIAFLGTAYRGWQLQPDRPTVQGEVERAMRRVLQIPKLGVVGCGRTDTGVHASQYFLHFDLPDAVRFDDRSVHGLNSLLPDDIAAFRTFPVGPEDHARFSAAERGYGYHIHRRKDPFLEGRSYLLRPELDVEAMDRACRVLVGRQDFSSFCKAGSDSRTMICDVREARWERTEAGCRFTIRADRFLRNMVRAIVGTSLRIGKGQHSVEDMATVLAAHDRSAAGKSAPARGLYLEHVIYPFFLA
ncbi:MAG: tRNA pseudouridine(38-40) synthase TruA [Flavobacteriales bacterium]|nr:tRNA pseudouridine(38-40) synthase TruA [Flavobacteriales bacterium]